MEGTLRVTPEKLTSAAGEFSTIAGEIQTYTTNMTETVNALSGAIWSGEAATSYKTKFNGLQDDINRMISMVREHSTDLTEMANEYTKAETEIMNATQGLSSDVIS